MTQVIIPDVGSGEKEVILLNWLIELGKQVEKGQEIAELSTDKATFTLEAPTSGILKEVFASSGQSIPIGSSIGVIE